MIDPTEEQMKQEKPLVWVPSFCDRHIQRLISTTKLKEKDPWRAFVVGAQIAMFQAATITPSVQKALEGDIEKIKDIGCLACWLPHRFDLVINAAKGHDLGKVKALGESWIAAAAKKEEDNEDPS